MWASVQQTSGKCPSSRSKHASCSSQSGLLYVLGGRSANLPLKDLWKYDPGPNQWEEIRCRGNRPPCLQEHTMVAWRNFIYIFGGEVGFASTGETPLWILDIDTGLWRKHHSQGDQPSGRRGHTAVVHNGAMHIYGGYQDLRGSSNELWSFEFESERWHLTFLTSQVEQAPPRHNHSSVIHDGGMWVYGGMTDLQERSDFWRWDFVSRQWLRIKCQRGPGEMHAHVAVKVMNYMYLFGGERAGIALNELWRYHFATETWEKIQVEGVMPSPRCRHIAIANPSFHNWQEKVVAWEEREPLKEIPIPKPIKLQQPPKSISMCFGQNTEQDGTRRPFKFRVHPVSRLCSKNTTSDEDDDDQEYVASYNPQNAQVNISRTIREKITTSRLVRGISSGSYNILHNQAHDARCDELERLVEESTPQHRFAIQKSLSSEAVLETDSETSTPQHKNNQQEVTSVSNPLWDHIPVDGFRRCDNLVKNAISPDKATNGVPLRPTSFNGHSPTDNHRYPTQRNSRISALTTVRDVEEENSEIGDEYLLNDFSEEDKISIGPMLIDLDSNSPEKSNTRSRHSSDLTPQNCTPSVEICSLPHSISHSSGYHSFTEEELGLDYHKEIATVLNGSSTRKNSFRTQELPLELKTFTPTHQPVSLETEQRREKERARSWDRASQRRIRSCPPGSITPTILMGESQNWSPPANKEDSPSRRWARSPAAKAKIEHRNWQLCFYVIGGREQGAPGVYRQPISVWKLYI